MATTAIASAQHGTTVERMVDDFLASCRARDLRSALFRWRDDTLHLRKHILGVVTRPRSRGEAVERRHCAVTGWERKATVSTPTIR